MRKFIVGIILIVMIFLGVFFFREYFLQSKIDEKEMQELLQADDDYRYFYDQLTEDDQKTYQRIYYALQSFAKSVPLEENNIENIKNIFNAVCYDHPEFYYVSSQFQYQENHLGFLFYPQFNYKQNEVYDINHKIEQKISSFIKSVSHKKTQLEKARLAYDYIIDITQYQTHSPDNQNMVSVFVNGKTVCAGYAKAYQYLLNQLGIEATYIVGTAKKTHSQITSGDGHAWVMVHLDDDFYYCDPTWGDIAEKNMEHPCYGYFMMSSDDMLRCYQPNVEYEKTVYHRIDYFQESGYYMTSLDKNILSRAIKDGKESGRRIAEIKCANENIYQTLKSQLENSYLGYEILSQNGCWSENAIYSCQDHIRLVEIYY